MMMIAGGFTHAEVALCIGARGISEPTLRKHFEYELTAGVARINALCTRGIVGAMMKGQAWALCFWAKTRMGWREKEVDPGVGSLDKLDEIARLAQHGPAKPEPPKQTIM